jgi:hypothetical protein
MPLVPMQFTPGIVRDRTSYAAKGAWIDCNLVRFRLGLPETMGGWQKLSDVNTFLGTCRALHVWFNLNNDRRIAVGTHRKYYLEFGQGLYDITPVARTATLTNPFTATIGSTTLNVTDAGHGAVVGAFVTFSGATSLGGSITATILNQEYEVTAVVDSSNYQVQLSIPAAAGDTNNGGTVTAAYQANPGLDAQVGGNGWGSGTWGTVGWGQGSTSNINLELRIWMQDNFGEDLIYNIRNGGVFYWANSSGLTTRGVRLADRVGADAETPTIATQVLVSDRDRHVIAFGANSGGTTVQDPLRIRFSNQEDPLTWIPTATNTAGDLRLGSGSRIIRALETKREILVWTDAALYSMQFIGPPFTFGVQQISSAVTVMGFNAFAQAEDVVYWMGNGTFWAYSGQVQELPCTVKDFVFKDMNKSQSDKVFAGANTGFAEIIWFYPSANSTENNRYVIYNYREQAWYYGSLSRTAWIDCCPEPYPVAAGADNYLYYHELGLDDGSTTPPQPLPSYLESAPFDLADGTQFVFVRRIIPDLSFYESTGTPFVQFTIIAQNFPGSPFGKSDINNVVRESSFLVEQYTTQLFTRLRARSVRFRIKTNSLGARWRLGVPRLDLQPDGRR